MQPNVNYLTNGGTQQGFSAVPVRSEDAVPHCLDPIAKVGLAIKGLNQKLEQELKEGDAEISQLKNALSELKAAVANLRSGK